MLLRAELYTAMPVVRGVRNVSPEAGSKAETSAHVGLTPHARVVAPASRAEASRELW